MNVFALSIIPILSSVAASFMEISDLTNPDKYKADERPPTAIINGESQPVKVYVSMRINSYTEGTIDDYSILSMYITEEWIDKRLKIPTSAWNDHVYIDDDLENIDKSLWSPGLVVISELSFEDGKFYRDSGPFEIKRNGLVEMKIRIDLKITHRSAIQEYFSLQLMPFNYTDDEVTLMWKVGKPVSTENFVFHDIFDVIHEKDIDYGSVTSKGIAKLNRRNKGNFSCLYLSLPKSKRNQNWIIIFIPSAFCVLISWISFWIDKSCVLGRSLPVIGSFVFLMIMKTGLTCGMLIVNGHAMLSSWFHGCLAFVVTALIQTTVLNYIYCRSMDRNRRNWSANKERSVDDEKPFENVEGQVRRHLYSRNATLQKILHYFPHSADDSINAISRGIFPTAFIIFMLVFMLVKY